MFARATRSGLGVQIGVCSAGMGIGLGYGFTTEAQRPQRKQQPKNAVLWVPLCLCVSGVNNELTSSPERRLTPRALTTSAD